MLNVWLSNHCRRNLITSLLSMINTVFFMSELFSHLKPGLFNKFSQNICFHEKAHAHLETGA